MRRRASYLLVFVISLSLTAAVRGLSLSYWLEESPKQ